MFSRDLLPDNVQRDPDKVQPSVLSSRNSQSDNVRLYQRMFGPTGQRMAPPDNV
jgi:hypothetical protein